MQIPEMLKERIEAIVSESGFRIFDLKLIKSGPAKILRILIDAPRGGITIKECADISKKLNELVEKENLAGDRFAFEVFSPGMDWPLIERRDYERILSRKIHLELKPEAYPLGAKKQAQGERSALVGILREVKEDSLILEMGTESVEIRFDNISRAKEQY